MNPAIISSRYARALFEVLTEAGAENQAIEHLRKLTQIFEKDPEFFAFFQTPLISIEQKTKALEESIKNAEVHPLIVQFLALLVQNHRFHFLPTITTAVQSLVDQANGVCRGYVRSASQLDQAERQALEEQLKKVVEKQVVMAYQVDPSLLGGMVAQVGSYTLDDSILTHLNRLNDQIHRSI